MRGVLRRMGNSSGVIIPKPLMAEIGAKVGDDVEILAENGRLMIVPVRSEPRTGWAEDAKRIAAAGDDGLVWPEFGNEADAELVWWNAATSGSRRSTRLSAANP